MTFFSVRLLINITLQANRMENVVHDLMSETEDKEVFQEVMYECLKNSCLQKTTKSVQFTTKWFKLLI